jgi:Mn2+/Fe2+ NRAMP family transporter
MPARHITSDEVRIMANRYSKNNNSSQRIEEKSMQKYQEQREKLNTGATIMALLVALAMIVTTFLASGVFFFD